MTKPRATAAKSSAKKSSDSEMQLAAVPAKKRTRRRSSAGAGSRPSFTLETLDEVITAIRRVETGPELFSARQLVAKAIPEIRAAMKKGYTLEAIAKQIKPIIHLEPTTLRGYLYSKDKVTAPLDGESDGDVETQPLSRRRRKVS